jgi:hypothetical protein
MVRCVLARVVFPHIMSAADNEASFSQFPEKSATRDAYVTELRYTHSLRFHGGG